MAEYLRNQQSQVSTLLELLHIRAKHFLTAPFQEPQTGLLLSAPHPPAPLPSAVLSFFLIIIFPNHTTGTHVATVRFKKEIISNTQKAPSDAHSSSPPAQVVTIQNLVYVTKTIFPTGIV